MGSFGDRLRQLRTGRGLGLRELARRALTDHTYLWEIETGRKPGTVEIAARCDAALDTGGQLAALARGDGRPIADRRPDVDRRTFLNVSMGMGAVGVAATAAAPVAAAAEGGVAGTAQVDAVRRVTRSLMAADEMTGGGAGYSAATRFLSDDVNRMLAASFSPGVREEALASAAEAAYLVGWKAHDGGRQVDAVRFYRLGLDLADASQVPGADLFLMRISALQAADAHQLGLPGCPVGLREAAEMAEQAARLGRRRLDRWGRAQMEAVAARCAAEAGDAHTARVWLRGVEPVSDGGPVAGGEAQPQFAVWAHHSVLVNQIAHTYAALDDWSAADQYYRAALAAWDPATHARAHMFNAAMLGRVRMRAGDTAGAVALWDECLPVLRGLSPASARSAATVALVDRDVAGDA